MPFLLHAADTAHELVDGGHFKSDVVDTGIVPADQGDRMVIRVATQEHHLIG